jgi:hypothetical protein
LAFVLNLAVGMQMMAQDLEDRRSSGINGGSECLLVFQIICQCESATPTRQTVCYTHNPEPLDHKMRILAKSPLSFFEM